MWSNLKSILKDGKTKCVIIEDGEPRYIIIPLEEYQHLQECGKDSRVSERSPARFDSEARREGRESNSANGDLEEAGNTDYSSSINIEDLPF